MSSLLNNHIHRFVTPYNDVGSYADSHKVVTVKRDSSNKIVAYTLSEMYGGEPWLVEGFVPLILEENILAMHQILMTEFGTGQIYIETSNFSITSLKINGGWHDYADIKWVRFELPDMIDDLYLL